MNRRTLNDAIRHDAPTIPDEMGRLVYCALDYGHGDPAVARLALMGHLGNGFNANQVQPWIAHCATTDDAWPDADDADAWLVFDVYRCVVETNERHDTMTTADILQAMTNHATTAANILAQV